MTLCRVGDLQLLVEASGNGEPVVLVHGSWDDRQVWTQVEADLVDGLHVVSYDRRGHGGSADSPTPGSRRDDEDDLAALIETLDIVPAHVVGNSFGASIALGLAARRGDLFRSLCVHEPPLMSLLADDPAVAGLQAAVARVVDQIERGEAEDAARTFVEIVIGPGAWDVMPREERAGMTAHAGTFAGEQVDPSWADIELDALGKVGAPVLLTQGDQSPPMLSAIVARLADVIAGAQVLTLPGAGHVPHETHPDEYATAIRRFVTGDTPVG
ncbi:MAG: alpha/beta hydrolase [Actinomycetia bacterium]|nr:alpha/beta hydrolase [Actinomycetes bacterium]